MVPSLSSPLAIGRHRFVSVLVSVRCLVKWSVDVMLLGHDPQNVFTEFKFWLSDSLHSFRLHMLHLNLISLMKASKSFYYQLQLGQLQWLSQNI